MKISNLLNHSIYSIEISFYKKIISLLLLFITYPHFGQVSIEWSNYPGGVSVAKDQLHHVFSVNWDYNPAGDISLTKRSTDGVIMWSVSYDNTDNTRHEVATWIETDSENNCLIAGTIRSGFSNPVNAASLLMKYDTNGTLLWRSVFESSFEGTYTKKIIIDSFDNIYVLGTGIGTNGLVTRIKKFNQNGDVIWTYYDNNGIGAPINIKFTPDNALLVIGRGVTGIVNGYLKLDVNGNYIWSKTGIISPTIGDAAGDTFGNSYLINGENVISNAGSILQKLNPNGNDSWSHTNVMAGSRIEIGSDDNPIISGFPNANTGGAAFMKYNQNGSVMWQNLDADGPEILLLHGQLKLDMQNNAYLAAGNLFNMAICKVNSDGLNGWVALVSGSNSTNSFTIDNDDSIYLIGGTTAKLSQENLQVTNFRLLDFAIIPNPFDSNFELRLNYNETEKTVYIYDFAGKKIYESIFSGLSKNIDLSFVSSGLYYVAIKDQNGAFQNKKIMKK